MFKQYHTRPTWDATLAIVGTVQVNVSGTLTDLVTEGVLDTAGAPIATVGVFLPGARILNSVSGITYVNTGTTASPAFTVDTVAIADGSITKAKLAVGVKASYMVVFAGQPTTAGGSVTEVITTTGALITDFAFVQVVDNGTSNVTVLQAVVTADTLTVTFSADPGSDTVINYQIVRATS